jgi:hypothetical protein
MLEECDALQKHTVTFSPVSWHQRQVQALFIAEEPGNGSEPPALRVSVGPMEEGTRYAFGPVRDRKLAGDIIDDLGRALGRKVGRDGLVVPRELEADLVSFFSGRLAAELAEVDKRRRSIKLWFKPTERKALGQRVKMMKTLLGLQRQPPQKSWGNLLGITGLMMVPEKPGGSWQLHSIVASRPRAVTSVRGEPEPKLRQAGLGRRLVEKMEKDLAQVTPSPLSQHDVNRINATLWWIYNGRSESRFVPIGEIDLTSAAPESVARGDELPVEPTSPA